MVRHEIRIPHKFQTWANRRGKRQMLDAQRARERAIVCSAWRVAGAPVPTLPARVTLIRIAPRRLDAHDNLPNAFKPAVDELTDLFGLSSDRVEGITWAYDQAKEGRIHAGRVIIEAESIEILLRGAVRRTMLGEGVS